MTQPIIPDPIQALYWLNGRQTHLVIDFGPDVGSQTWRVLVRGNPRTVVEYRDRVQAFLQDGGVITAPQDGDPDKVSTRKLFKEFRALSLLSLINWLIDNPRHREARKYIPEFDPEFTRWKDLAAKLRELRG